MPVTGEFGGAAAPRLSPDGKSLAFVPARRREDGARGAWTWRSGGTRRLADRASQRDNQEGFAFHGVFPGYAWMPDGRSIVATADGRIWRFDARAGTRTPIPFTAQVEQRVDEALRFPQELGGDTLRARIVRWPVESPDGKRLVFSAVGHLYAMDLPGGHAAAADRARGRSSTRRPSRADGTPLAFVTWNDRAGGHVWTVPMGTDGRRRAPRRLTEVPGQYANPAFSPDGTQVVYVRGSGATFRDDDLGDELWERDPLGRRRRRREPLRDRHRATAAPNRRMARPTFSRRRRAHLLRRGRAGRTSPSQLAKTVLVSVKLDGTDRKVHLRFDRAEEAVVSPDERWVAFSELHNAYVTALPPVGGQPVDVAAGERRAPARPSSPTRAASGWAGPTAGKTITWVYGPTYRRLSLDKALSRRPAEEEAAKERPRPRARRRRRTPTKEEKEKKSKLPQSQAVEIVLSVPRAQAHGDGGLHAARGRDHDEGRRGDRARHDRGRRRPHPRRGTRRRP